MFFDLAEASDHVQPEGLRRFSTVADPDAWVRDHPMHINFPTAVFVRFQMHHPTLGKS